MNQFLQELSKALKMVWLLFPAILFILITGILFSTLNQGQDVLLIAVESRISAMLLVLAVAFLAFINWYTSRLIVYIKAEKNDEEQNSFWYSIFPRVLGYFTFFAMEAAIINHPYFEAKNDGWWVFGLLLAQLLVYWLLQRYFKRNTDYKSNSTWLFAIVLVVVLVFSFFLSARGSIQHNFVVQLISLWVVQTAFLIWNFIRRKHINQLSNNQQQTVMLAKKVKVITLPASETVFFKRFNLFITIPLVVYIVAIFSGTWARHVGPVNIVLLSFAILAGFLQMVSMLTIWRSINFHFILWTLAIVLGFFYSPYDLRKTKVSAPVYNNRPTLATYTKGWIDTRREAIVASQEKYPVYFVLSDGGASRSGYWVASALGKLETSTQHKFSQHLFCLSGASGGSVGNAVFYALLDSATRSADLKKANYDEEGRLFLKSDFLSSTLSHLLGPDYFRHLVPLGLTVDRSAALEESMESPNDDHFMGRLFAKKYSEYISSFNQNAGQLPIFYINTTRVKDGSPGVIGNVQIERAYSPRVDVLAMMDTAGENRSPFGNINYSSAAILSARFPYLSPAANIDNEYFVDGGYFDNSGAGIVLEALSYIQDMLQDSSYNDVRSKLEFHIIHVSNSEGSPMVPSRMHPLVNDLFTPLLTLAGSYGQQTNVNNDRLRIFVQNYVNPNCPDCWTRINLYDVKDPADKNGFSMNWVISDTTLRRMNQRITENENLQNLIIKINGLH
jgi:predicted acylesterase/phospholipase RssA